MTSLVLSLTVNGKADTDNPQSVSKIWYEGNRLRVSYMSTEEIAIHFQGHHHENRKQRDRNAVSPFPEGRIISSGDSLIRIKLPRASSLNDFLKILHDKPGVNHKRMPVFYQNPLKASGLHIMPHEMIVHFHSISRAEEAREWAKEHDVQLIREFGFDNAFLFTCAEADGCIDQTVSAYHEKEVKFAYPNWLRPRQKRFMPNDPLYPSQWHLENTGQGGGLANEDVNVLSAWESVDGAGINIAIADDGLEIDHEDLLGNVVYELCYDYVDDDEDPTPGSGDSHGTSCAGVAAAIGGNETGITGAAPMAGLIGFRLPISTSDSMEADTLTRHYDQIDIVSISWGPDDDGYYLEGPGPLTKAAMADGVMNGRGGKGSIYVWAGGNGNNPQCDGSNPCEEQNDNSNYDGYANSRYVIAVAASTNYGTHSDYSEKGANILVNAPSSGYPLTQPQALGITTLDITGPQGDSDGNYTSAFGGTSAVAPLVSGIIALILDANPDLTWRDIKQILAKTSEMNDPTDPDWTKNAAGYWINHKYGYGRVDAGAAVSAAVDWPLVDEQIKCSGSASPDIVIPDNDSTGVTSSITISENIEIEYVELIFISDHEYWGDLDIILESPSGTLSVLAENHLIGRSEGTPGNQYASGWTFGVARLLGESSIGAWTLTVRDRYEGDVGDLESWSLMIYGIAKPFGAGALATYVPDTGEIHIPVARTSDALSSTDDAWDVTLQYDGLGTISVVSYTAYDSFPISSPENAVIRRNTLDISIPKLAVSGTSSPTYKVELKYVGFFPSGPSTALWQIASVIINE